MRLFSSALAMLSALVVVLTACGSSGGAAHTADGRTVVRYQGWAGEVRFQELAEDLGYYQKIKLDWVGNTTSGPQDIQSVATGDIDVGEAFNGAVVKLNAAGAPITSVLSSYGADEGEYTGYFVLENSPIRSARDLIGKKVGMNTLGAHHEFLTREWLAKEGLTNDEIKTVTLTVVPPVNTEQALREKQIDVAALNGIWRETAQQRGGIRPLFTDKSLFGAFSYGTFVVRDDFLAENRDAVADYVQGTARAIRWTEVTPRDEVVAKFRDIIAKRKRNEDTQSIEYWRSSGIPVPGAVIAERELQTWIDWLVRNGELKEGQLKAKDLYTNEFNPYANGTYPDNSGPDGKALAHK
ncbi:ABC transporter substrate-binding protein [Mycolicibacterium conceptionense]|jgi:ABC-type nitrate/sulfonate/bicarbonate transport system substrate-binding protein|uniref:ABC transporter substrate-binding protein n=2 Tax=Mycolicibacterium TaxID=1866885 RepID=A0A0J8U378_9MYCO|nr:MULTISPECIES: ABC transporter substrate-binding protein [Mycolicibacterium]KLI05057.1 ABC transporter substrate-binding protein [Mycolicibacterium senegalense]KLO51990.1 ABC transporter substrate-binding protein [Mycolicibacterium senegalense]KMV15637.1 ABC transporter substrate-binding protein [Mycolicibacterium conceptionense]MCW1822563.1 ABC transporter substrate-binding protein [Mycolicibacterium senegalense]OBB09700.1 ABC transporter substrate-binding protein [Mycolicibacterium concept